MKFGKWTNWGVIGCYFMIEGEDLSIISGDGFGGHVRVRKVRMYMYKICIVCTSTYLYIYTIQ